MNKKILLGVILLFAVGGCQAGLFKKTISLDTLLKEKEKASKKQKKFNAKYQQELKDLKKKNSKNYISNKQTQIRKKLKEIFIDVLGDGDRIPGKIKEQMGKVKDGKVTGNKVFGQKIKKRIMGELGIAPDTEEERQLILIFDKAHHEIGFDLMPLEEKFIDLMLKIFKLIDPKRLKERLRNATVIEKKGKEVLNKKGVSEKETGEAKAKSNKEQEKFSVMFESTQKGDLVSVGKDQISDGKLRKFLITTMNKILDAIKAQMSKNKEVLAKLETNILHDLKIAKGSIDKILLPIILYKEYYKIVFELIELEKELMVVEHHRIRSREVGILIKIFKRIDPENYKAEIEEAYSKFVKKEKEEKEEVEEEISKVRAKEKALTVIRTPVEEFGNYKLYIEDRMEEVKKHKEAKKLEYKRKMLEAKNKLPAENYKQLEKEVKKDLKGLKKVKFKAWKKAASKKLKQYEEEGTGGKGSVQARKEFTGKMRKHDKHLDKILRELNKIYSNVFYVIKDEIESLKKTPREATEEVLKYTK